MNEVVKIEKTHYLEAIDPSKNVWINANAGSGKTTILINRILTLCIKGASLKSLLVITYTNNAIKEIKDRLVNKVFAMFRMNDEELQREIVSLLGFCDANEMRGARNLFIDILFNKEAFNGISTIHSFCNSFLSSFYSYRNLPSPNLSGGLSSALEIDLIAKECFENYVLEFLNSNDSNNVSMAKNFLDTLGNKTINSLFKSLNSVKLSGKNFDVDLLVKYFRELNKDDFEKLYPSGLESVDLELNKNLHLLLEIFCWKKIQNFCISLNESGFFSASRQWKDGSEIQGKFNAFVIEGAAFFDKSISVETLLIDKIESDILTAYENLIDVFCTKKMEPRKRGVPPNLTGDFVEKSLVLLNIFRLYDTNKILLNSIFFVNGVNSVLKRQKLFLEENNFIDNDGLLEQVDSLLSSNDSDLEVESFLKKYISDISHVLLDEAQDISPVSWSIIFALLKKILISTKNTIAVVGDEKQSIFSFQGADVKNFVLARDYISELLQKFSKNLVSLDLNRSYRTSKNILNKIDELVNADVSKFGLHPETSVKHISDIVREDGFFEENTVEELACDDDENDEIVNKNIDSPSKSILLQWKLPSSEDDLATDAQLDSLVSAVVNLKSRVNGIEDKDIMVLIRNRNAKKSLLLRAIQKLRDMGISCDIDEFVVNKHIIFQDLLLLCKFIWNSENDLNLFALLRSCFFNLEFDDLLNIAVFKKKNNISLIGAIENLDDILFQKLKQVKEVFYNKGFLGLLNYFFYEKEVIDIINSKYGISGTEVAESLFEFCYDNLHHSDCDIIRIMSVLGSVKLSSKTSVFNGVRFSTIHSAKGSESPAVIFCNVVSDKKNSSFNLYKFDAGSENDSDDLLSSLKKKISLILMTNLKLINDKITDKITETKNECDNMLKKEENRLLYVALTRCKYYLYVISNSALKIGL